MTRRGLLASTTALPLLRSLDLVKVTCWNPDDGVQIYWRPRAVVEKGFRDMLRHMQRNRH